MTSRAWAAALALLSVAIECSGCGRADLYAVTDGAVTGGSSVAPGTQVGGAAGSSGAVGMQVGGAAGSSGAVGMQVGGAAGSSGAASTQVGGAAGSSGAPSVLPNGCPSPALVAGDTSLTLQVGSATRSYVLHVPSTYDGTTRVPLVVDFHGVGSSGWGELTESPYPAVTDPEGVVVAFPDGMPGPAGTAWNLGPCCVPDADDLSFTRALVTQIQASACIEPRRIYAVGVLTGAGMVYSLACQAADVFAAVAPAAFDLLEETVDDCSPSRPMTVISFRGTATSRVPYEGGASSLVPGMPVTFLGAVASFERWARIDGCTGVASAPDASGCSSYAGCPDGVEVVLCTAEGGGLEPGDASVAWPVLKRHAL